jgi:glutaminyl-peptide cyclotransferase
MAIVLVLVAVCVAAALLPAHKAKAQSLAGPDPPKLHAFQVVRELPHDATAFTQGLQFDMHDRRPTFWESTGMYGHSELRELRFPCSR